MAELVNGIDKMDLAKGGIEFETTGSFSKKDEGEVGVNKETYHENLKEHTNFDCLPNEETENTQPFEVLSSKMDNIKADGSVKKRILREGYGNRAGPHSKVKINYNAYVEFEAHPFDSTYARKKPFSFTINGGEVIEGLETALCTMRINERAQFLMAPEVAFKDSGLTRVPPNSTVLFDIECLEMMETTVTPRFDVHNLKTFEDVFKYSQALVVRGNNKFKKKDYSGAILEYELAVKKMEDAIMGDFQDQEKSDELLLRLYTNLLVCHTHLNQPKKGCLNANKIYRMTKAGSKVSIKVYFNNARCLRFLGDFNEAEKRLKKAFEMEPGNRIIDLEFKEIQKCRENARNLQRQLGKALVSGNCSKK